jgi:hypothetical protein
MCCHICTKTRERRHDTISHIFIKCVIGMASWVLCVQGEPVQPDLNKWYYDSETEQCGLINGMLLLQHPPLELPGRHSWLAKHRYMNRDHMTCLHHTSAASRDDKRIQKKVDRSGENHNNNKYDRTRFTGHILSTTEVTSTWKRWSILTVGPLLSDIYIHVIVSE